MASSKPSADNQNTSSDYMDGGKSKIVGNLKEYTTTIPYAGTDFANNSTEGSTDKGKTYTE